MRRRGSESAWLHSWVAACPAMTASPVQRLTALLRRAGAVPALRDEAVAPSSIYDPLYRAMVIALTMRACGRLSGAEWSLSSARLKLAQFVAIHPELLPSLRGWVAAHRRGERPTLEGWAQFPRGYAADAHHERVLTYLVATGELRREGKNLVTRAEGDGLLAALAESAEAKKSFAAERDALQEMAAMKITLKMLGA
jgi:hypothetical protein